MKIKDWYYSKSPRTREMMRLGIAVLVFLLILGIMGAV
jgi:hypothetical protein